MFEVTIRFIEGRELRLPVADNMTVEELKKNLIDNFHFQGELSLIFRGTILPDDRKITSLDGIDKTFIIGHVKKPKRDRSNLSLYDYYSPYSSRSTYLHLLELRRQAILRLREQAHDPPNFNELVQGLTEMGFDEQLSKNALRMSSYSQQIAITMLLNGSVPLVMEPRYGYLSSVPRLGSWDTRDPIFPERHADNLDLPKPENPESNDPVRDHMGIEIEARQPPDSQDIPPLPDIPSSQDHRDDERNREKEDSSELDSHSSEEEDFDHDDDEEEEDGGDFVTMDRDYLMNHDYFGSGSDSDESELESNYSDMSDHENTLFSNLFSNGTNHEEKIEEEKTENSKDEQLDDKIQDMYDRTHTENQNPVKEEAPPPPPT